MGFYDGHMSVELYKGGWILRARIEGDRPVTENSSAERAMRVWRQRNREKYESLQ